MNAFLITISLLTVLGQPEGLPDSRPSLEGRWKAESIFIDGSSTLDLAEEIGLIPVALEIKGKNILIIFKSNRRFEGKIAIKNSNRPRQIDFIFPIVVFKGIYAIDGDILLVAVHPGGVLRPTRFANNSEISMLMYILRRQK